MVVYLPPKPHDYLESWFPPVVLLLLHPRGPLLCLEQIPVFVVSQ